MSINLESIENKSVLVGLTYFDNKGQMLTQRQLSGVVKAADAEQGITIVCHHNDDVFVLPAALTCWFYAPEGNFRDPNSGEALPNPDFLVTWDVYQKQESVEDGNHQWWEWHPRTTPPQVKSN